MATTEAPEAAPPTRLWRSRDYLFWLGADTTGFLGLALYAFVMPLMALMVLDDPAAAGLIAAAGQVARVASILPGGVLSDRHDRKRLMVIGGVIGALILGAFVLVESLDELGFWVFLTISVVMGLRNGLLGAASNSALKQVVATPQLPTALSANQARDGAIQVGAAPLGGLLLAVGPLAALLVPLVSFLASALSAIGIRVDLHPRRAEQEAAKALRELPDQQPVSTQTPVAPAEAVIPDAQPPVKTSMFGEAREGLAWVWRQPVLRDVLFVSTIVNLGTNAALTTLIFAFQQDGVSPAAIGLVSSGLGAAMILGALAAPWLVQRFPTGVLAIAGLVPAVIAILLLPLLDTVPLVMLALGIGFIGSPATNAGLIGYAMAIIPKQLMGRAMTAFELFAMGAVPLAPVIAGFGLGWIGRDLTLVICAAFCLTAVLLALTKRDLRRLPRPDKWPSVD